KDIVISENQIKKLINKYFKKELDQNACQSFFNISENKQTSYINNVVNQISKEIFNKVLLDVEFTCQKDPSFKSKEEVINSKANSLVAVMFYRIANYFYYTPITKNLENTRHICREMMEYCL